MAMDYKSAGVDVEAGYKAVELMKGHIEKTIREEVIGGLGGFGGMFSIAKAKDMAEPVLVCGTDGVGTKLKIAFLMDKHDTIGLDCVAMCVNDIICSGAEPLLFLDYFACGKNYPEKIEQVVKGVAEGCVLSGAALIGGETAEMPGFYPDGEYDLAGFCVGLLDKAKMIDGRNLQPGDSLIGIASSGLHSNGFSLARQVLSPTKENVGDYIEALGCTLGEALLTPTKIYAKTIGHITRKYNIKGIANITGGGFYENIPRMIPEEVDLGITIKDGAWKIPPIFQYIMEKGGIEKDSMYHTFNMGIGMVVAVAPEDQDGVVAGIEKAGEKAFVIGQISKGKGVTIC